MRDWKWIAMLACLLGPGTIIWSMPAHGGESGERQMSPETQLPDIAGQWDAEVVTTSASQLPVLGEVFSEQRSVLRVYIDQRGPEVQMRIETCAIDVHTSSSMVSMSIPSAFVDSMSPIDRRGRIESTDDGFQLLVATAWETQGIELQDPPNEALPDESGDHRVFDQDGDGHPGVTVRVGGIISGDVYVIQKGWDRWQGRIEDDVIEGSVRWGLDQRILGASSRWLQSDLESSPRPGLEYNYFRMQRGDDPAQRC